MHAQKLLAVCIFLQHLKNVSHLHNLIFFLKCIGYEAET